MKEDGDGEELCCDRRQDCPCEEGEKRMKKKKRKKKMFVVVGVIGLMKG